MEKTTHHKHTTSRNLKLILLQADDLNFKAIILSKKANQKLRNDIYIATCKERIN